MDEWDSETAKLQRVARHRASRQGFLVLAMILFSCAVVAWAIFQPPASPGAFIARTASTLILWAAGAFFASGRYSASTSGSGGHIGLYIAWAIAQVLLLVLALSLGISGVVGYALMHGVALLIAAILNLVLLFNS